MKSTKKVTNKMKTNKKKNLSQSAAVNVKLRSQIETLPLPDLSMNRFQF